MIKGVSRLVEDTIMRSSTREAIPEEQW